MDHILGINDEMPVTFVEKLASTGCWQTEFTPQKTALQ